MTPTLRITGSNKKGYLAQYHAGEKLLAIGKGQSMAEAKLMADRMMESLKLARGMKWNSQK